MELISSLMGFIASFLLYYILLNVTELSATATSYNPRRAKYGEHCNKTVRCDTSSLLSCRNSLCDCYKTDTMFYDPVVNSCLVLVGEKCIYPLHAQEDSDNMVQYNPSRHRDFQEELECVQNAWCNGSGVCMCSESYIELNNGTCISRRNFEESCTSDFECRQDRFLSCINGKCGCNDTTSIYNNLLRQCVGKAGQPCIGMDACIYNAECSTTNSMSYEKGRAKQNMKICSCNPGHVADSSGKCKVGLKEHCSDYKPCADSFKCKDGQCVCKFENLQLAMVRSQTCVSLVGGPCNETIIDMGFEQVSNNSKNYELFQCVDNSQCKVVGNTSLYECQCNNGFVSNKDGTCDLAYGERCKETPFYRRSSSDNVDSSNLRRNGLITCDRTAPLFCVNGKCQCESSLYVFSANDSSCLGKYGAKCSLLNDAEPSNNLIKNIQCIEGAECVASRESTFPTGKCICSTGFTLNKNRTCSKV